MNWGNRTFRSRVLRSIFWTLLGTCLLSCGDRTGKSGSSGPLRRGLAGEPASLDPAEAADNFSFQVLHDLYEGLTVESGKGDVLPGVASSWTVDNSGTEYTFHLR